MGEKISTQADPFFFLWGREREKKGSFVINITLHSAEAF